MTKDEMKNRISMALKDPVLQQGFEIICKENAELDCQMNRNKYCYSCVNATDRCFRKEIGCPCEKYKSYKDENAELKDKLEVLIAAGNACTKGLNKQLTKAKEILRKFLDAKSIEETCVAESEAEQLLNEYEECFVDFHEKWHLLADGDTPKDSRYVWTNVGPSYYDHTDHCWRDEYGRTQGVIAWCEPKFEE